MVLSEFELAMYCFGAVLLLVAIGVYTVLGIIVYRGWKTTRQTTGTATKEQLRLACRSTIFSYTSLLEMIVLDLANDELSIQELKEMVCVEDDQ